MTIRKITLLFSGFAAFGFVLGATTQAVGLQRGGAGKSASHVSKGAPQAGHSGPGMSRPAGGGGARQPANKVSNPKASPPKAGTRPTTPKFERPTGGNAQPKGGGPASKRPNEGKAQPKGGGPAGKGPSGKSGDGPFAKGPESKRPRPGGSDSQVNDFLGIGENRPSTGSKDKLPGKNKADFKDNLPGKVDMKDKFPKKDDSIDRKGKLPPDLKEKLPKKDDTPDLKGKLPPEMKGKLPKQEDRPDVNIGNVNIGNTVDYSKDQKAWVNNQHVTGNQVRANSGNRYATAYSSGAYRQGLAGGGYPYSSGWASQGQYYGWRPSTYAGLGTFLGAGLAQSQPVYYAYGAGGNVYYENDTVYVNGTASGTPEQYSEQVLAAVAAAPAKVEATEWMPLGTFAVTREGVDESQSMVELAISKSGVVAGTYYNETTELSRPLKGTVDPKTQRVSIGFADGKNDKVAFETGLYNLTQEEAPGLLHLGTNEAKPVLLVRLQPPEEAK